MKTRNVVRLIVAIVLIGIGFTAAALTMPAKLQGNLVTVPATWKTVKDLQAAGWDSEDEVQKALNELCFCCEDCMTRTGDKISLTAPISGYVLTYHDMFILESDRYRIIFPKTQDVSSLFYQIALFERGQRFAEVRALQGNPPLLMMAHWKSFEPPSSYRDFVPAGSTRYVILIEVKDTEGLD